MRVCVCDRSRFKKKLWRTKAWHHAELFSRKSLRVNTEFAHHAPLIVPSTCGYPPFAHSPRAIRWKLVKQGRRCLPIAPIAGGANEKSCPLHAGNGLLFLSARADLPLLKTRRTIAKL